jgi:hypothetical protein
LTDLSTLSLPRRWPRERKQAWRDLVAELPHLNIAHIALLEVACDYRARVRRGAAPVTEAIYLEILRLLGATPVSTPGRTIIIPEQ